MGCLVAFLGGMVGGVVGIALTYPILSGQGADALEWAVTFVFLALIGLALGATAALLLRSYAQGRKAKPSK